MCVYFSLLLFVFPLNPFAMFPRKDKKSNGFSILGDMLGGHLDDMEKDWSKPIVSMRYHGVYSCALTPKSFRHHFLIIYYYICLNV